MVFGLVDWMIIGAAAMLGVKLMNKPKYVVKVPISHGIPLSAGPIRKPIQPGDIIVMANASPYNYEPDGNLL